MAVHRTCRVVVGHLAEPGRRSHDRHTFQASVHGLWQPHLPGPLLVFNEHNLRFPSVADVTNDVPFADGADSGQQSGSKFGAGGEPLPFRVEDLRDAAPPYGEVRLLQVHLVPRLWDRHAQGIRDADLDVVGKSHSPTPWETGGRAPRRRHGPPLSEQVAFEEVDRPVMDELRGVATREPMALTSEGHV